MKNYSRDLLVLYKAEVYNEGLLQYQVECLHEILKTVERNDVFCLAHELVTRLKISRKSNLILKAVSKPALLPFYFLINKN